ncbi:MAG: hypothetical protein FWE37_00160 [Spirochaetaceae bacterium]|nr:hypothetical protein [Spirochaetaceae bacterium]
MKKIVLLFLLVTLAFNAYGQNRHNRQTTDERFFGISERFNAGFWTRIGLNQYLTGNPHDNYHHHNHNMDEAVNRFNFDIGFDMAYSTFFNARAFRFFYHVVDYNFYLHWANEVEISTHAVGTGLGARWPLRMGGLHFAPFMSYNVGFYYVGQEGTPHSRAAFIFNSDSGLYRRVNAGVIFVLGALSVVLEGGQASPLVRFSDSEMLFKPYHFVNFKVGLEIR